MANPVKTPNVEYPREFQHLYAKENKSKTNPTFVFLKKQLQFVHKVGQDGNRSKKKLCKFL